MKVTTIVPPPVERWVTIEMSEDEARSLLIVCGHIGGDHHKSRRGHFETLAKELRSAGINRLPNGRSDGDHGSIYFDDLEE